MSWVIGILVLVVIVLVWLLCEAREDARIHVDGVLSLRELLASTNLKLEQAYKKYEKATIQIAALQMRLERARTVLVGTETEPDPD